MAIEFRQTRQLHISHKIIKDKFLHYGAYMEEHREDEYNLVEYDDYWLIPLQDTPVTKIVIGLELRMEFTDAKEREILIWIGGEIRLQSHGKEYKLKGDDPKGLAPILNLWGSVVDSARAHKDGRLQIQFKDGSDLNAYALPETEAWGVTGERWLRIACMPGGDLAVWTPDPPETEK